MLPLPPSSRSCRPPGAEAHLCIYRRRGAIAQGWARPWIFWVNVPIGLAVALLVLAPVPASRRRWPGPAVQKAAMGAVGPAEIGQASGAFSMLRQLGGVFGIAIVVSVLTGNGGYASAGAFTRGFAPAMGTAALLALAGAAAAAGLPRRAPGLPGPGAGRGQHPASARGDETPAPAALAGACPAGDGVNWGHGHRQRARGVQQAPDG